ncbi:MAG: hypothetical protein U0Q22_15735 [Acidimicrobiales bacterium]
MQSGQGIAYYVGFYTVPVALLIVGLVAFIRWSKRTASPPAGPPPNWYPDPWGSGLYRWWDGVQWRQLQDQAGYDDQRPPGPT